MTPCWPVILDIKKASPAWRASPTLKIGDQIKEIDGIPTENLKYSQILNLFTKATDTLHVVIRRGMEPTKRAFDWFRFPFLSVARKAEAITISWTTNLRRLYDEEFVRRELHHSSTTTSFKRENHSPASTVASSSLSTETESVQRFKDREISFNKTDEGGSFSHGRSFSASATNRNTFMWRDRQRRKTVQETMPTTSENLLQRKFASSSTSSLKNINNMGRSIFNEAEMRRLRSDSRASSGLGDMSRKSSQSSLASSTSTISSFASSTHIEQQV